MCDVGLAASRPFRLYARAAPPLDPPWRIFWKAIESVPQRQ
jgi:hypothetical protein